MCDRKRECEDSNYWRLNRFSQVSRDLTSREVMHVLCTWLECEESIQMETALSRKYLVGKAFPRDTRETFCSARLYYLIHTFCTHTIYIHITHKCQGVLLRENSSLKPWELEIIIPIYLYTFACEFPQLLPLHFHTIERLIAQTIITPFQSVKWSFGAAGKHWKKLRMADATWSLLRDPES